MLEKKSILIGCDDTMVLTRVLNILATMSDFAFSSVSVSRAVDLNSTIISLNPDLIILCFRNNQHILRDNLFSSKKLDIPILCLTQSNECESLCWSTNCIVFTYSYNHINNAEFLVYRIRSIFLLKKAALKNNTTSSFAETALKNNNIHYTKELSHYVMELDQKVEVLKKVKERISYLFPNVNDAIRQELMSIVNSIKAAAGDNKLWDDFKIYFEQSNPDFLLALAQKHPSLSPKDLKYCCYIKMNMSNNDITNLLGINQDSVRTHKYRLKKKLTLKKDQDIISYLRTVS
ncbi:helix-turn-helix transcriptional regulator [Flavobacterium sp. Root901]|uniref:helix-turn-helix transcriptional regulator n=1 Tax=Flavobacterium sp. Root901 TaxID=1736605 RepID=UPI0012FE9183|nr:LuxR C-terminal-related transcriptional regulator [Flavobacterium sp. Root901]